MSSSAVFDLTVSSENSSYSPAEGHSPSKRQRTSEAVVIDLTGPEFVDLTGPAGGEEVIEVVVIEDSDDDVSIDYDVPEVVSTEDSDDDVSDISDEDETFRIPDEDAEEFERLFNEHAEEVLAANTPEEMAALWGF